MQSFSTTEQLNDPKSSETSFELNEPLLSSTPNNDDAEFQLTAIEHHEEEELTSFVPQTARSNPYAYSRFFKKMRDAFHATNSIWVKVKPHTRKNILEVTVGTSFGILATAFSVGTTWIENPLTYSFLASTLNYLRRMFTQSDENEENKSTFFYFSIYTGAFLFGYTSLLTVSTLIHESGHALAGTILYKNANPHIELIHSGLMKYSGQTNLNQTELSWYGNQLGEDHTQALIDGAGISMTTLCGYLQLVTAQLLKDDYPELAAYLRFSVILNCINDLWYAYTPCSSGDDFCDMEREASELTPVLVSSIMIGSLISVQLFLSLITHCFPMNSANNRNEIPYAEVVDTEDADPEVEDSEQQRLVIR